MAAQLQGRARKRGEAATDRILVIIHLAGGNDGLNTVVPIEDDIYYRSRPALAIPKADVLRISDHAGLHPSLAPLLHLPGDARLSIIQGVGYPGHDSSHARAVSAWNSGVADGSAVSDRMAHPGMWIERYFAAAGLDRDAALLSEPGAELLQELAKDGKPGVNYPDDSFAAKLRCVAMMINRDSPVRVFHVRLDGFDTHTDQFGVHGQLLQRFSRAVAAFQYDLQTHRQAERVMTMAYSEFGRRVAENPAGGTDHGTAGPMFVIGTRNKPGLIGRAPRLDDLEQGNLKFTTDFRAVYAGIVEEHFGVGSGDIFGGGVRRAGEG